MRRDKSLAELEAIIAEQNKHPYGRVLALVGGWQLGCLNAVENSTAIIRAIDDGLVGFRMHYAQAFPDGVEAYEITDKGIEMVRELCGPLAARSAQEKRDWYRENTSKPKL